MPLLRIEELVDVFHALVSLGGFVAALEFLHVAQSLIAAFNGQQRLRLAALDGEADVRLCPDAVDLREDGLFDLFRRDPHVHLLSLDAHRHVFRDMETDRQGEDFISGVCGGSKKQGE